MKNFIPSVPTAAYVALALSLVAFSGTLVVLSIVLVVLMGGGSDAL